MQVKCFQKSISNLGIEDVALAWVAQMVKRLRNGEVIFEMGADQLEFACAPLRSAPLHSIQPSFKVYPTLCDVKLNLEATENGLFTLYQTNGSKVLEENFEIGKHTFSTERLPAGVYYARFISKNNQIFTQKIIKNAN